MSRWGLYPETVVLIRDRRGVTDTQKRGRQGVDGDSDGLDAAPAWEGLQSPEAGRGRKESSQEPLEGTQPSDTLRSDFCPHPQAMRKENSVVLGHQVCGHLLQRPQETEYILLPFSLLDPFFGSFPDVSRLFFQNEVGIISDFSIPSHDCCLLGPQLVPSTATA